ncbi:MAG: hypothetical protein SVX43_20815, partial [Cyanobacteriota bacterium]|nr:hypothetical protein [Cyanobacteriota bacterium]
MANKNRLSLNFAIGIVLNFLLPELTLAEELPPPAPILNDEGGPTRLVGQGHWSSLEIPIQYDRPAVVLLDRGATLVEREGGHFAPKTGQIFGDITSNVLTSPFTYTLELPTVPRGQAFDVDGNDRRDSGVQIWAVTLANNAIPTPNEPFLSPVEQLTQLSVSISSLITALPTNIEGIAEPTDGALLVYASE